jgi:hypothetical protein
MAYYMPWGVSLATAVGPSLGVYNGGYQQQGLGSNPLTVVAGDTQSSGSSLLIFSAAKLDDVISVTHNKTGTLSNLGSLAYTVWGPYGARMDAVASLTGGTGQSASISLIPGNSTDEKTMFVMEVKNGQTITLDTPAELPASGASVVTGNSITTTGAAVLFCCVWGDGNISTPMNLTVHADSLAEGWSQIGDISIDGIAHIQGALAVRTVSGAGTYGGTKWDFDPAQRALFFAGKVQA